MISSWTECEFEGKQITTFYCCSENGGITSKLLKEMLKKIDKHETFDRSDGIPLFLLLDGHGSQFQLDFLENVNDVCDEGHKWNVCVGVPYGMSYWQVGDSAQQNGSFKIALSWAKMALLEKKSQARQPFAIEKSDIVPIVSDAWEKSFCQVQSNLKAVAEHGWGLLTSTACYIQSLQ